MSDKTFLDRAYGLESTDATKRFYNDWSQSYDAEVLSNGYVTHARCAEALASFAEDLTRPHLDIGCGTGVSGEALQAVGFTHLDGTDLSPEMIAKATEKNIYQSLTLGNLSDPFPFAVGHYPTISAIGVLNPGHAPAQTLPAILAKLAPEGLFTFSLNDHALADDAYPQALSAVIESGQAEMLFEEYGPHLPGIDLMSKVYVMRRL